jgi:hypothetical protein
MPVKTITITAESKINSKILPDEFNFAYGEVRLVH